MVFLSPPLCRLVHNLPKCHLCITPFFASCSSHHHFRAACTVAPPLLASGSAAKDWARKSSRVKQQCCCGRNRAKLDGCVVKASLIDPSSHLAHFPAFSCLQLLPRPTPRHPAPSTPLRRHIYNLQKVIFASRHSSLAAVLAITSVLLGQPCHFCLPLNPLPKIGAKDLPAKRQSCRACSRANLVAVLYTVHPVD